MKSTFSLSFFLKRTVRNKNGEMPIIGRITVNGNAVEFRPHLSIKSELWSVAKGKAIGRSAEIVQLNTMLNSIRKVISAHYQTLSAEDGYVTAEKIREAYLGQDERTLKRVAEEKRGKTTLIDFFGKFNAEYKLKVDAKLGEGVEFPFFIFSILVFPTFFLCVFPSGRSFSFQWRKKVGLRTNKVLRREYYLQ